MAIWQSTGIVKYDPNAARSTFRKWWVILQCDKELIRYYQHIYYKLYWRKLQSAIWGCHCSIVRGEKPINTENWKQYNGREIAFEYSYDGEFMNNGRHYWLKCWSKDFGDIRSSLGLNPNPSIPFHLSIGSRND